MSRISAASRATLSCALFLIGVLPAQASERSVELNARLQGFDGYMEKLLKDWNGVGFGVGVVVDDELVFARGYGYRDYARKLPLTPQTLFPIASNTKLFAAASAGMLVDAGELTWDSPVRESVPSTKFYDDELDRNVSLRDMLAHRTGITRHDMVWFKSDLDSAALFARLRYLEPSTPLRQTFLYNNLMYAAVGHIVALKSGKPWPQFVKERILEPLDMRSTVFSIAEMKKHPEYALAYNERRESGELYQREYYEGTGGLAAAGAMISNLEDISHWLIALMNEGRYAGRQVLPAAALKATLEPAIAISSAIDTSRGWRELLNPQQGMGRHIAVYRGNVITYHGGDLPGFHSQISYLPERRIGVIVIALGDHTEDLYDPISYQVYERALGLDLTPWSERLLALRHKSKQADQSARAKAGDTRVRNTKPSHPLADYVGEYEHPAYGTVRIGLAGRALQFDFHDIRATLSHYHFDRFDTPDDEEYGKYSLRFSTDPQGAVDRLTMSLDEADAAFVRRPQLLDAQAVARLVGTYVSPTGVETEVILQPGSKLVLLQPGRPDLALLPYQGRKFRVATFADVVYEFVEEEGRVSALRRTDPEGVRVSRKR